MTDYSAEQKEKMRVWQEHENALREKSMAERAAELSLGNRHARRKMKVLNQIEGDGLTAKEKAE